MKQRILLNRSLENLESYNLFLLQQRKRGPLSQKNFFDLVFNSILIRYVLRGRLVGGLLERARESTSLITLLVVWLIKLIILFTLSLPKRGLCIRVHCAQCSSQNDCTLSKAYTSDTLFPSLLDCFSLLHFSRKVLPLLTVQNSFPIIP